MDITKVLVLAWPRIPGQDSLEEEGSKKTKDFINKLSKQRQASLAELMFFARRDNTPSLKFSDKTRGQLLTLLTPRCREAAVKGIEKRLDRSLSLIPQGVWAERIFFDGNEVFYNEHKDASAELAKVRKHLVRD
ncbi:hypothetical protein uan_103 [Pseudomonas phage UAntarctica]|nr:hypothetical protein uan_103 [Pseudomonas phage UAntarctica]